MQLHPLFTSNPYCCVKSKDKTMREKTLNFTVFKGEPVQRACYTPTSPEDLHNAAGREGAEFCSGLFVIS